MNPANTPRDKTQRGESALNEVYQRPTLVKWPEERHLGARHALHGGFLGQILKAMIDKFRSQSEKRCIKILWEISEESNSLCVSGYARARSVRHALSR